MDRLTGMTNGAANESYAFDAVGNRTASHLSATYTHQPFNKLTATANATFSYDANGNMLSKSDPTGYWVYGWDHENRMISARKQNKIVRYEYDALGRRVSRQGKTLGSTKYVYDGLDVVMDIDGSTVTRYQNGPGIDNKLSIKVGTTTNYFIADHLGSTVGLTDSTGALDTSAGYDSFGNQTGILPTRYGFTGRERDDFTGLMHYRARQYDPKRGRFISEDPIGFAGGDINLYGYVWNRPNRFTDPSGKFPKPTIIMFPMGQGTPSEQLDKLQLLLAGLGLIPGFGEPADGLDGAISLARGDYVGASMSATSMIPYFGWGAGITKICSRLSPKQTGDLIDQLRKGDDIYVDSVDDARQLLDNMPDLRPGGTQMPFMNDPPGTFRGDLIDTRNPFGDRIHKEGVRNDHALNPHYNIRFHDGTKASIIIKAN